MKKERKIVDNAFEDSFVAGEQIGTFIKKNIMTISGFVKIFLIIMTMGTILFFYGIFHSFKPKNNDQLKHS